MHGGLSPPLWGQWRSLMNLKTGTWTVDKNISSTWTYKYISMQTQRNRREANESRDCKVSLAHSKLQKWKWDKDRGITILDTQKDMWEMNIKKRKKKSWREKINTRWGKFKQRICTQGGSVYKLTQGQLRDKKKKNILKGSYPIWGIDWEDIM